MEKEEYARLYNHESSHWWYRGLHLLVLKTLNRYTPNSELLLDAGCGTGGLLEAIDTAGLAQRGLGIDISADAIEFCHERGLTDIAQASVLNVPFADQSVDTIVSLDVLYHMSVSSDEAALAEFFRLLKPQGILLLNLPAFESLRGSYDESVKTRERYTLTSLGEKVLQAGFEIEYLTYRNFLLFPLVWFYRKVIKETQVFKENQSTKSDLWQTPWIMNFALLLVLRIENLLLPFIKLPIGTSVFCVARRV